ncbi:hypothetical protein TGMAS_259205 [Toxoplasma gondii MAS]|uniref:Uncharacterized protein n=1 Tax=Toxoplasma gondii MAS TaxID=943118 RepID=A0A086PSN7_TOXGO|nr:hypothetical protein TGMAS_259205 [Toxoplasma gondii MAS]
MNSVRLHTGSGGPREWAGEWSDGESRYQHAGTSLLLAKMLLVSFCVFAVGSLVNSSHASDTSGPNVHDPEKPWPRRGEIGPLISRKPRTAGVEPVVPVIELLTVSPSEYLDFRSANMVTETVDSDDTTATSRSTPGPPLALSSPGDDDPRGKGEPPEKTFELAPFLERRPHGLSVSIRSEDTRPKEFSTDLNTTEFQGSSEKLLISDISPSADPPHANSGPGADIKVLSNLSPSSTAASDKNSEERHLRPQPFPVAVPFPVPYYAGMYPAVPPPAAAPAAVYTGRIAVPPPFLLSPLAAGPTVPAPSPAVIGAVAPPTLAAPVMYGPPAISPAVVQAVPVAPTVPVQQVTVTVTPTAAPAPFLAWVVPAAR